MKLKYYLRGAGIGVIVSTLILMIAFGVSKGKTEEPVQTETEDSAHELTIAEALSELETETRPTETETEEMVAATEATEAAEKEEASEAAEETADVKEAAQEDAEAASAEQETLENGAERIEPGQDSGEGEEAAPETPVEVKKTVSVVVQGGDSPKVVAEKLVRAGAVDNADRFYGYLLDHGLNDGIEIGNFSIPEGADYETVAKIITTNEFESRMQR